MVQHHILTVRITTPDGALLDTINIVESDPGRDPVLVQQEITNCIEENFEVQEADARVLGRATASWQLAANIPAGTRVVFVDSWDIFPQNLIIWSGEKGVVTENELKSGNSLWVLPDSPKIRDTLMEWDGRIQIGPTNEMPPNTHCPIAVDKR